MSNLSNLIVVILLSALITLAACAPQSTPTLLPGPPPTRTVVPLTVTNVPPTATIAAPTSTRVPPTSTAAPTPTRVLTEPPPVSVTVILNPSSSADQTPSTATFTARGNKTEIALSIKPSTLEVVQPTGIYEGSCVRLGNPRYSLANVVDGKSVTTIDMPIATLLSGALLLDIKRSTRETSVSALCSPMPEAVFFTLEPGKHGNQSGTVIAFQQVSGTEVDVFIKPGPPGLAQPALIREGTCAELGGIRYSLNHIVDGTSKTFFGVPFSNFRKEKGAMNVHKSLQELDLSVACGLVKPADSESTGLSR